MTSDDESSPGIFLEVPGGRQLLDWFGTVPTFHDAEITSLQLSAEGKSALIVNEWKLGLDLEVLDTRLVVFEMSGIVDFELNYFSRQNSLWGLALRHGKDRPNRLPYTGSTTVPTFEIWLHPNVGLSGFIRCRTIGIRMQASGKKRG